MNTKILPNGDFFAVALDAMRESGRVEIPMQGVSMYPLLRQGIDRAVLEPVEQNRAAQGGKLKKGDVVLFDYRGTFILHRIVKMEGEALTLRGDHILDRTETAHRNQVKARLAALVRPDGKVLTPSSFLWRGISLLARLPRPVRRAALGALRRIVAPAAR